MTSGRMKIGDFSRLAQVSVRTLRLYDELGLLKPESVDRFTEYRTYNVNQLPRIQHILALKDLGLSLDQIGAILGRTDDGDQLQMLLRVKESELAQTLAETEARLARVRARMQSLARGEAAPIVQLKPADAVTVVSHRMRVPHVNDMDRLRHDGFAALNARLRELRLARGESELVLYHNDSYTEEDIDTELTQPVEAPGAPGTRVIPAEPLVASLLHHGLLPEVTRSIIALFKWIGDNGYESCGPIREWHHFWHEDALTHWGEITLELQVPVRQI